MDPGISLRDWFAALAPRRPVGDVDFAVHAIDACLTGARQARASDVHLIPSASTCAMYWRIDGVLHPVADFPREAAPRLIARLKVLAQLLTYQTELPQEGRISLAEGTLEMRVSTFPTLFGEKAVIRLLGEQGTFTTLDSLGLGPQVTTSLREALSATSGCLIVSGPAGSGKTTTLYACLRELVDKSGGGKSLVSLEDPVEAVLAGVAQSQVNLAAGFDLPTGLRSLMRQDPEVLMVGEIRDRDTAEIVFQAALTGHLVLTTFHTGSAAGVVSRLSEMGIEPYLLRSGLRGVLCQRLFRQLCTCSTPDRSPEGALGLAVTDYRVPQGCSACRQTGYLGRQVLGEWLPLDQPEVRRELLARTAATEIAFQARAAGMVSLSERARQAVELGLVSPAEYRRVLGFDRELDS